MSEDRVDAYVGGHGSVAPETDRRLLLGALAGLALVLVFFGLRTTFHSQFDIPLIRAINSLSRRWPALDLVAATTMPMHTVKGIATFGLVYVAFAAQRSPRIRAMLVGGCVGAMVAALCSRGIQFLLPPLPRPLFEPGLNFIPPELASLTLWKGGSSYPSDTTTLLFGVACAISLANRAASIPAAGIAILAGLTRIYCGRHFPSDVLGGAAFGVVFALLGAWVAGRWTPTERMSATLSRAGPLLIGLMFFVAVQAATMFEEPRRLAAMLLLILHSR